MKLLAPEILGPLSQCSTKLRIRGNVAGAAVSVLVNGTESASHVTSFCDGVYAVGVSLSPDDVVTVMQSLGQDKSAESLPVTTQLAPSQPSAMTLQSVMYQCGRALWLSGGVPGAQVQGHINNTAVGSGSVLGGAVGFTFNPVLDAGKSMALTQSVCNGAVQKQDTPAALTPPSPLPKPKIQLPLIECQTTITVSDVVDGAYVELYRNGVLEKTFTFASSSEWRRVKELKKGDVIEVRQGFKCKKESPTLESFSGKRTATVESTASLKAPKILGQPCPGTTYLTVTNLIPGARVVLTLDDEELGQTDVSEPTYTFQVPPLPAGGVVKAFMMLCKKKGPAAEQTVSSGQQSPDDCKLSDLYQCAAHVLVKVFPTSGNYLIYITNKAGQQISTYVNLVGYEKLIPVSPSLIAGDEISVHILGCGGQWQTFGPFAVSAGTPPPPSFDEPLEAGDTSVTVFSEHAGARIDLYVNNVWKGKTISTGNLSVSAVAVSPALKTGDSVFATQTLCGKPSKPSNTAKVKKARPLRPVLLKPDDGAQGVNVQPLFQWQDPGANQENAAESFRLIVMQGGNTVLDTTTNSTQLQSPAVLNYETSYVWKVEAINSTGSRTSNPQFGFSTQAKPAPQKANLHFDPPILSSEPNFPRYTAFALMIDVVNDGNATSGEYTVAFSLSLHNGGALLDYVEDVFTALGAGQTTTILSVPVEINTDADVRVDTFLTVNGTQVDSAFRILT